jgi:hypothetical protein
MGVSFYHVYCMRKYYAFKINPAKVSCGKTKFALEGA